ERVAFDAAPLVARLPVRQQRGAYATSADGDERFDGAGVGNDEVAAARSIVVRDCVGNIERLEAVVGEGVAYDLAGRRVQVHATDARTVRIFPEPRAPGADRCVHLSRRERAIAVL